MPAKTKVCTKCRKRKLREAFWARRGSPDGKQSMCKVCKQAWCVENAAKVRAYGVKWRLKHPEKLQAYRLANKEKISAAGRAWYKANLERERAKRRAYAAVHRQQASRRSREHYETNREWVNWSTAQNRILRGGF